MTTPSTASRNSKSATVSSLWRHSSPICGKIPIAAITIPMTTTAAMTISITSHASTILFSLYPTFAFLLFVVSERFCQQKTFCLMHFSYNKRVVVSLLRLFTVSVLKFKIRASPFESSPRTLPPQLTRSRHPHGTQELLLRAAPFLTWPGS